MMNDMFYQTNTQGFCPFRAFAHTPSYPPQGVAVGLGAPLPLRGVLDAAAYVLGLMLSPNSNIEIPPTVQQIFETKHISATKRRSFEDKEDEV